MDIVIPVEPEIFEMIEKESFLKIKGNLKLRNKSEFKVYLYIKNPIRKLRFVINDGDYLYGKIYHGKTVFVKTDDVSVNSKAFGKYGKIIAKADCERKFSTEYETHFKLKNFEMLPNCMDLSDFGLKSPPKRFSYIKINEVVK